MAIKDYYLTKTEDDAGETFLLKQLQKETATGGGRRLLGSVVKRHSEFSPFSQTDYAIPRSIMSPGIIEKTLRDRKEQLIAELEIEGDVVLDLEIAPGQETVLIKKDKHFQIGIADFPLIPLGFALQLDYTKMVKINIKYGEGTVYKYLPPGYMMWLRQKLGDQPTAAMGGNLLKTKEYVYINQIMLARNWSVSFESNSTFDAGFDAKLAQFHQLPEIAGKVKVHKETANTVKAEISGEAYFVVGLSSFKWKDLR